MTFTLWLSGPVGTVAGSIVIGGLAVNSFLAQKSKDVFVPETRENQYCGAVQCTEE